MPPTSRPDVFFSAPHDFLMDVLGRYRDRFALGLDEVWFEHDLPTRADAEAWVPNPGQHFVIGAAVLDRFPRLRVVATPSTGRNHIDLDACASRGVEVRSLLDDRPALEAISASAEFTFLHVLNSLRRIDRGLAVPAAQWRLEEASVRGHELAGRRVGLVGFGRIGRRMARYCGAFDASVSYFDPYVDHGDGVQRIPSLEALFEGCDVVVVCAMLTEETRGMIGGDLVRRLPHGAVMVNTSRGELLDEPSVAAALEERDDIVFAADVVTGEVSGEHAVGPLIELRERGRVLVTPHIAGVTFESQAKAAVAALELVATVLGPTA